MTNLVAADAIARAEAQVGNRITPTGMCLNFVWRMYGAVPSVGTSVGKLDTAWNAWQPVESKHFDRDVPRGFYAMLGPSPTRTDRNRNAGDIILSRGDGTFVCTDASGNAVGIMTLAARERQTQRPYVGWGSDLGGHSIIGVQPGVESPHAVPLIIAGDDDMQVIKIDGRDLFTVGQEYIRHNRTLVEADIASKVSSTTDEVHSLTKGQAAELFNAYGIPLAFLDADYLEKHGNNGTWSRGLEAQGLVKLA